MKKLLFILAFATMASTAKSQSCCPPGQVDSAWYALTQFNDSIVGLEWNYNEPNSVPYVQILYYPFWVYANKQVHIACESLFLDSIPAAVSRPDSVLCRDASGNVSMYYGQVLVPADTTSLSNRINVAAPTAAMYKFAGASTPDGWLPCNGAGISRTTYASLFAIIGTTYGPGDGATTFNLPSDSGFIIKY